MLLFLLLLIILSLQMLLLLFVIISTILSLLSFLLFIPFPLLLLSFLLFIPFPLLSLSFPFPFLFPSVDVQGNKCNNPNKRETMDSSVPTSHNCIDINFSVSANILTFSNILSAKTKNFLFVTRCRTCSANTVKNEKRKKNGKCKKS